MSKKKSTKKSSSMAQGGLGGFLRQPAGQITVVAVIALIIYLIASTSGGAATTSSTANEVTIDEAYEMYQSGEYFVLDVRTQEEWDEYHAPDTTLIPLDQLENRLSEIPADKDVLVICRSGNRSQQGRDILVNAGFNATSMAGGLKAWYASGYPTEGQPAQ